MDLVVLIIIFVSVYFLFELVINKILISYSVDRFYESMKTTQFDLNNAVAYIEEKKELPYKKFADEIFSYVKLSTLKRAKYDNSIAAFIFPEKENYLVIGEKKRPELKINVKDVNFNNYTNNIVGDSEAAGEGNKNYIEFNIEGRSYIGIAEYSQAGIRSSFDRDNNEMLHPIILIADNKSDFFFILDRVRNIFFILLSLVIGLGAAYKIYNTFVITREIYDIRDRMTEAGKEIREQGLIGSGKEPLKKNFIETTNLDDSFRDLTGSLLDLGNIISGIADRDLFTATLRKDNSLLSPHDEMMTIMFLDIQDFTGITERHKDNIMGIINRIWTEVQKIIGGKKGKINKLIGDAALLIFLDNHKEGKTNSSINAFYAAVELLERVEAVKRELDIEFNFRIGLDYGKVTYGKTGSDMNYELGVIGDPVNTASRLESLSKQYHTNLLLTQNVLVNMNLKPDVLYNLSKEINSASDFIAKLLKVDKARPKGKKEPIEIYTLIKKRNDDFSLIGQDKYFTLNTFKEFQFLLDNFINSINIWHSYYDRKKSESDYQLSKETADLKRVAEKRWSDQVRVLAEFFIKTKLPLIEHFISTILKYEEFDQFKKIPAEWLKREQFQVKEPSKDWIENGTLELEK